MLRWPKTTPWSVYDYVMTCGNAFWGISLTKGQWPANFPLKGTFTRISDFLFVVGLKKLLNKQSSCQRYEMPCHSCDIPIRACFLSLAQSKLRLCSANHRPGYWSNLPCDWPSTAWAYSWARDRKRAHDPITEYDSLRHNEWIGEQGETWLWHVQIELYWHWLYGYQLYHASPLDQGSSPSLHVKMSTLHPRTACLS